MGRVPYNYEPARADDRRPKVGSVRPSHRRRWRSVWAPCGRPARPAGARYARPRRSALAPATAAAARYSEGGSMPPPERSPRSNRRPLSIAPVFSIAGARSAPDPARRSSWTRRTIYCNAVGQLLRPLCVLRPGRQGTHYNRVLCMSAGL